MSKRRWLKRLKEKEKPSGQQCKADQISQDRHVYVESGIKVDLAEDLREKYISSQNEDGRNKKDQLFWAKASAVLIAIYASVAIWQACATQKTAIAAKSAADTAARQLDMSERPWINPDIGIIDNVLVAQTGITVKIGVHLKNSGHSPATALRFQAETIANPEGPTGDAETIQERDRVCGVTKQEVEQGIDSKGETIFPDSEGVTRYVTMVLAKNEMDAVMEKQKSVAPMIVTCVAYVSTFEKTVHTTAKVFLILRADPVTKIGMAFYPSKEVTVFKPDQVIWIASPVAGVYAN